jgi:hypothetical protein
MADSQRTNVNKTTEWAGIIVTDLLTSENAIDTIHHYDFIELNLNIIILVDWS